MDIRVNWKSHEYRLDAEIVEVIRIDLYGAPSAETVDGIRRMGSWPVGIHAHVNGFGHQHPRSPG
jgi:hypothetical protein